MSIVRWLKGLSRAQKARAWALSGEVGGLAMSSWLNGAQAASHAPEGNPGPVIVAMSIPLGLFIALRVLTTAPVTGWWRALLWPGFSLLVFAFAVVSFRDQQALLVEWGFEKDNDGLFPVGQASLLPLAVDGLMAVCAVALLALAALDAFDEVLAPVAPLLEEPALRPTWGWTPTEDGTVMQPPRWANPEPQPEVETSSEPEVSAPLKQWKTVVDDLPPFDPGTQEDYTLVPPPVEEADRWVARKVVAAAPAALRVEERVKPRSAPRRATAPASRVPSNTKQQFLDREGTDDPMTWEDVMALDGGTKRSAEGKLYRWRKALKEAQ